MNSITYTLVTGASGGIGKEIAEEYARRGNNLILVARSKDKLKNLVLEFEKKYQIKALAIPIDLCKEESAKIIYDWCIENNVQIDALINNAGAAVFGEFEKIDIEKQTNIINLNISSLVKLTHYFIPELKKVMKGYILNVASIAALYPLPYYCVYGATKAFVLSFTEALRFEMRNSNINVCCLCPSDTNTNFFITAGNKNEKKNLASSQEIAKLGVDSLFKNEPVIGPRIFKMANRLPKGVLKRKIAKRVSKYKLEF